MAQSISANTELILHPYGSEDGRTIVHVLIEELLASKWDVFRGAVHFVKQSGHYDELMNAMKAFLGAGGTIQLTFGADVFGQTQFASEYAAVADLLDSFEDFPTFSLNLYHEMGRTFHPKVYLFSNEKLAEALVIVGSSNWSAGGFSNNVEVNVKVHLSLDDPGHRSVYDELDTCFDTYWSDSE